MTTATFAAYADNSTTTNFRTWGLGFSTALAAVGMVKTTDTGQIDWSTVNAPVGGTSQMGYEIWRFNDSLQSTAPIYLRIGYGSGASAGICSLWFTIGKGSDGAGNISGVMQAASQTSCSGTTAAAGNWYVSSGDGSMLAWSPNQNAHAAGGINWWGALERSRDTAGAPTAVGFWFARNSVATIIGTGYNYAAATSWDNRRIPVALPCTATSDLSLSGGGTAPVYAALVTDGLSHWWQARCMVTGMRSDVGVGSSFTVPGFGVYLSCGASAPGADAAASTYATACIRWS